MSISLPTWNEDYIVGVKDIDLQHKYFLELIHRFYSRQENGASSTIVLRHLEEIMLYSRFHFCSEENLMIEYNYPDFERHEHLHIGIIDDLTNAVTSFRLKEISFDEMTLFLVHWFKDHTVTKDRKFADFLNAQK